MDFYHLFKLGTSSARIIKASKGVYDIVSIFQKVRNPMLVMGVSGFVDGALDDAEKIITKKLGEETNGGSK